MLQSRDRKGAVFPTARLPPPFPSDRILFVSMLRPSLQLRVAQKQILTPGLVQMVTVLQLNRLELKEMITQEIVENPVLEESSEEVGEEITAEEILPLLEPERVSDPSDQQLLEATMGDAAHTNGIAGEAPAELGA